jgi:hypothetical protein
MDNSIYEPDPRSDLALSDEDFLAKVEAYLVETEGRRTSLFMGRAYIRRLFDLTNRPAYASTTT